MRTYHTVSGVYTEDDLVIAVWVNPKSLTSKKVRPLETLTSPKSVYPMAFPKTNIPWPTALHARTKEDVYALLPKSDRLAPLVIPVLIAKEALGWDNIYVATEYTPYEEN
jgi:hypothetical protein